MLKQLLNIAKTVKCVYPDISKNDKLNTKLYYSSYEDILNNIKNDKKMDCGSVIWNILLQYYIDESVCNSCLENDNTLDLLKIYNPKFHLFFNKDINDKKNLTYNLTYVKYEPFHLLYDQNITELSTNNMGYWCINLGIGRNIKQEIESFVHFDIDYEKECYLVFWPDNGMIICNIDFIITNLINDAKKDIEYFKKSADNILATSILGLLDIFMIENNITFDSIKVINMGYLFESNENKNINLANMCMNKGINLIN